MIIALFPNIKKSLPKQAALQIREFLLSKKVIVAAEDDKAEILGATPLSQLDHKKIDFMISLGGDGTILRMIHKNPKIDAPIIGINLGSLGFMADITSDEIFDCLEDILKGHYTIQERLMMEGTIDNKSQGFAVNEVVIHRAKNPCLVDIAIHLDGQYINTFSADGIIIATPSGSTAYSLAAGGPILSPELEAFVLTPICPHTISNRPIVLSSSQEIQVKYLSEYDPVEVIFDGYTDFTLKSSDILRIKSSTRRFKLVSLERHNFFSTLRSKLGWSGKLKI